MEGDSFADGLQVDKSLSPVKREFISQGNCDINFTSQGTFGGTIFWFPLLLTYFNVK